MARRTIYLSDEQDWLYLRVKEMAEKAGESVGAVVVRAFQEYIESREREQRGLEPISLFIGEKILGYADFGEYVKFYGKFISGGTVKDERYHTSQELYRTKKNKLLLYLSIQEGGERIINEYRLFDKLSDLRNEPLASGVLEGLKNLEIGSRFIDC